MYHTTYLIHYNKNHSKANGQFTSGDGDGDGIVNDHANQRKSQSGRSNSDRLSGAIADAKRAKKKGTILGWSGAGVATAGYLAAVAGDSSGNDALGWAGVVTSAAGLGLSTAGAIINAKANQRLKKEVNRTIDAHYGVPMSKALEELQRE